MPVRQKRSDAWDRDPVTDSIVESVDSIRDRSPLAKAHLFGAELPDSNVQPPETRDRDARIFDRAGALAPPYPPDVLVKLFEHSSALRQNIDAYAVNIDGHGHRFEPVIDLDADDVIDRVRDAIVSDSLPDGFGPDPDEEEAEEEEEIKEPTDAEVQERIEDLQRWMRREKATLETFFLYACLDMSFLKLRRITRQDIEILGNGYWEVLRSGGVPGRLGKPAAFTYIAAFTVRLLPYDGTLVETTQRIKKSLFSYQEITVRRKFRRYVQVFDGRRIFFKEYGDPRTLSAQTGRFFNTPEELKSAEPHSSAATEILHFAIHSPRSPYGVPRWIGTLLAVLGSRQAEEVNFLYFDNKSVPPLAVLVSGGRLGADSVSRIESFVENRIRGRTNFHKILVIEADPAEGAAALDNATGRMRIQIVPLTGSQQADALFQNYDERNIDKVGMSFRLPRMLRGDIRDFNRATAEAALEFAETQVFGPERTDTDWSMNYKILTDLGVRFWTYVSNAPDVSNPMDLTSIITDLVDSCVLTPEEARELAQGVFNRDFRKIDEIWTKIPPNLLKAGVLPGEEEETAGQSSREEPKEEDEEPDPGVQKRRRFRKRSGPMTDLARRLVELKLRLQVEEEEVSKRRYDSLLETMEKETHRISAAEMMDLLRD